MRDAIYVIFYSGSTDACDGSVVEGWLSIIIIIKNLYCVSYNNKNIDVCEKTPMGSMFGSGILLPAIR